MSRRVPKRKGQSRFNLAPQANIQRSTFDLSHPYKSTFNSGLLIPVFLQEILPGDSFRVRMTALTRLATPLHPTMDNLYLESFFFFIPNRIVWENWQKFMGEQENPGDSTDYTVPQINQSTAGALTLPDFFCLPTGVPNIQVNSLPHRGYNRVWAEWFRDENLQDSPVLRTDDGPDTPGDYTVLRRGKRKDYISSSLPWPQKGPGSSIPLGTTAPVGAPDGASGTDVVVDNITGANAYYFQEGGAPQVQYATTVAAPNLVADLESASTVTINDLRMSFQIQKLQERDARGGTRYTEILRSHFQVISPDARLQRPEYLGGGHSAIQMHTVPQTSSTDATTPQGNLTAYGQSTITGHGFTKSFVEHGYILGLVSVRADLNYQNRIDRHWSRKTKYDYYWPALQALGEQPVYNREVFATGAATDDDVWGYQERWADYRSQLGKITGYFRSNYAESLDPWHYAVDFQTAPTLDSVFVEDVPPVKRTIADQAAPEFLFDAWFDVRAARPMPVYSVPGYVDHF